jgi:hypothetical protein
MSQPEDPGAATDPETGATENETAGEVGYDETLSPLAAQAQAPINAAAHFDEKQGTEGG